MLDRVDTSRIHARLFDLASNFDHEFTLIMENNRTQYVYETYPFQFFAALGNIKSYFRGVTSVKWLQLPNVT